VPGHSRWLIILLLAAPFPLGGCDSGGGEAQTGGPTTVQELLPPSGLTATAQGFSVELDWTAPAGGAEIIGWEVRRGDSVLRVLSTSATSLTDDDVRPGKKYTYEVRARGGGDYSEPATADVRIKVPPLKAARVEGDFNAIAKVVSKTGYSQFGSSTTFGWHFNPKCGKGACAVVWRDVFERRVHAILRRKGGDYAGNYSGFFGVTCSGSNSTSSVDLELTVKKARAIAGEWRATSLTGTLTSSEAPQFGCVSARAVTSIKARLRLAG
jgi:hypothetical protein